jgi:hypothetical protein
MTEKELIDAFIEILEQKKLIKGCQKILSDKGLQIKTNDGEYFNIRLFKLEKGDGLIVSKLRE